MTLGQTILDRLTDEQEQALRDGDSLRVLIDSREPLLDKEDPTSIDVLELEWYTQGTVDGTELPEAFPEVVDIEELE